MKKALFAGVLLAGILVSAYSDAQFRLAGNVTNDFSHDPDVTSVTGLMNDGPAINYGFHWEMILKHIGFGMHYLTRFDNVGTEATDTGYDWAMKLNTDLFLSYHIFGGGSFLDPFVEMGFGIAGILDTADNYASMDRFNMGTITSMAYFPYVAGGAALDLGGFLVGAKLGYRPLFQPIPDSGFQTYQVTRFQFGVFGGIALGGHR